MWYMERHILEHVSYSPDLLQGPMSITVGLGALTLGPFQACLTSHPHTLNSRCPATLAFSVFFVLFSFLPQDLCASGFRLPAQILPHHFINLISNYRSLPKMFSLLT